MAQSIKCTQCGAVMKSANPIAPGKKVKCPKCGQAFVVAAEEEENPFAVTGSGETKAAKSKGDAGGDEKAPPKKGKGMMIGLLIGGFLLVCCCCPGLGTGGWFAYDKFLSGPNIQGHWVSNGGDQIRIMGSGKAWIFDLDEVMKGKVPNPTVANAKYTIEGKTLDITMDDSKVKIPWADSHTAKFTFELKDESLTLANTKDKKETKFKKVDLDKVKLGK